MKLMRRTKGKSQRQARISSAAGEARAMTSHLIRRNHHSIIYFYLGNTKYQLFSLFPRKIPVPAPWACLSAALHGLPRPSQLFVGR
ncbi:hypothetical protein [Massilia sp. NR 4-1]|uniref:hypothetical protein n=1 Tax=Massilia sp. NR 4-1 TaxID=1678028 RepID=UPI001CC0B69D|nr:hypothetical protein [Massilia sp. NR 4-1]